MERRGLLKALGLASIAIPALSTVRLAMPQEMILPSEFHFADAREMVAYDIGFDEYVVRCDVMSKLNNRPFQMGVDWTFTLDGDVPGKIKRGREVSALMLKEGMKREGIRASDMRPMPELAFAGNFRTLAEFAAKRGIAL